MRCPCWLPSRASAETWRETVVPPKQSKRLSIAWGISGVFDEGCKVVGAQVRMEMQAWWRACA